MNQRPTIEQALAITPQNLCYHNGMTGSEIRTVRRKLRLTQQGFADKLGVAKSTVGRWEIDQVKPSPLAIARIKELEGAMR